jgi:hypothetical protein
MMLWCDFTTQMNHWLIKFYHTADLLGEMKKFYYYNWKLNFETVNTVGEDRLVRATIPLTVLGTLLSEQEARRSTLKKCIQLKN